MQMIRKTLIAALVSGVALAPAFAADDRMTGAVETRQGLFMVIRSYFGPMVAMARGDAPYDAEKMAEHAHKVRELSTMIPYVFQIDTRGADVGTDALPGIWTSMDDFRSKAAALTDAARALEAATADGKAAALAAFRKTGGACKGCHDEYRQEH